MAILAILLRAADMSTTDKYEAAFNAFGPHCKGVCIPVLETVLVNLEKLKQTIIAGPKVDGVIMTSARSCEAWKTVIAQSTTEQTAQWLKVPFYVVGTATANSLSEISPQSDQIRGEHSGTAEQLARFILEEPNCSKRLLYLIGDKNRETLTKILNEGQVDLLPLQVYETSGSSKFPVDLSEALKGRQRDAEIWITFFAPSAAEFVYPYLQAHFCFRSIGTTQALIDDDRPLVRIAAIGPTTASFLRDKLHLHVDAIPAKPNPESLIEAMRVASSPASPFLQ
ncbi:tetrapyrrole biosynthesis, uroporphyrinogen III synthase [Lentinula aciculospora]|uniref:Tetrapyrrole biosynthesis, uroporphyrinogen III synthase n=1 Tax=Lentinula aciculospora TaxID=153920 RepID=A0A9W9AFY8_9AGAR|nr:tetrapyrrole biosynthesis, uroporphyrinogen III synthase [Lentinula aciculospora]